MKYLVPIILSFLLISPVYAQQDNINTESFKEWTRGARTVPVKYAHDVKGSPFYNQDWKMGYVLLQDGKKSESAYLKYNTYNNQLLFKKNGNALQVIPERVKGFILDEGSRQTVFKKGFKSAKNDISPSLLLRVIYDGKVKLVAKETTRLYKPHSANPLTGERISKFLPKKSYFLIDASGQYHEVKLKQNDILEALSTHRDELGAYAQSKNLSFKDENDLHHILEEYDKMWASTQ